MYNDNKNEDGIVTLVPFDVKPQRSPETPEEYIKRSPESNDENNKYLTLLRWLQQREQSKVFEGMYGKIWTVVAIDQRSGIDWALLVRSGQLAQWYPLQFCEVKDICFPSERI